MSPKESDQINLVKNFPCDISDEEVVNFLKEEVDDKINANDINWEKNEHNTNVCLGPRIISLVIVREVKVLDFKTAARTFYDRRKLYVKPPSSDKAEVNVTSEKFGKTVKSSRKKIIQSLKLKLWRTSSSEGVGPLHYSNNNKRRRFSFI